MCRLLALCHLNPFAAEYYSNMCYSVLNTFTGILLSVLNNISPPNTRDLSGGVDYIFTPTNRKCAAVFKKTGLALEG